ncbi:hypothetical protein TUM22923_04730 [Polynucleobacter sp. TUM22923]|uniref:DUF4391 domain-containing protein n=1 Tax=Polynucleobacter sp. TUM22923 TaxID=3022126 RepID=UPI00257238C4|nr:DUF4391 domain-containing protein [Polynucleobacter sp. TUM22923]BDX21152.1 hypothetical protein TUM22923_04730 [Polynucleobacter sp. TUM22923]
MTATLDTQPVALFAWPRQAKVDRPVAKTKIYAHAKPSAALRAMFVEQVESITWAYKLSPETINLPAKAGVPEIEVFEVALKLPDISHLVLRCIDKAIPFPILFNLRFDGRTRPVAAHKRPSDAASDQWVVGDYHAAPWQSDGVVRPALPMALDLLGLYEQLLRQHFALPARLGESLRAQLDRLSALAAKQVAAAKLESRLNAEKQFNRKVTINAELRTLRTELGLLAS